MSKNGGRATKGDVVLFDEIMTKLGENNEILEEICSRIEAFSGKVDILCVLLAKNMPKTGEDEDGGTRGLKDDEFVCQVCGCISEIVNPPPGAPNEEKWVSLVCQEEECGAEQMVKIRYDKNGK